MRDTTDTTVPCGARDARISIAHLRAIELAKATPSVQEFERLVRRPIATRERDRSLKGR